MTKTNYLSTLSWVETLCLTEGSVKALRDAWPNRHWSGRATAVIHCNVRFLRELRACGAISPDTLTSR